MGLSGQFMSGKMISFAVSGGGSIVGLSLAGVVARCLALGGGWPMQLADWSRRAARDTAPLYALPEPVRAARALGADTRAALAA